MIPDPWIELNRTRYSIANCSSIPTAHLSTNQIRAVEFISKWLAGQTQFTMRTSGSTGTPKEINITRSMMMASAQKTIRALDLREGNICLVCLDVNYIAGMMMLVRSLTGRMNLVVTEPSARPLEGLPTQTIDFAALVPYQIEALIDQPNLQDLSRIDKIIIGGATIQDSLVSKLQGIPSECYATFGMTETVSHIALRKLNGTDRQQSYYALDGVTISQDVRDCLVIEADYLPGKIVTNDVVELISLREFKWLTRWDNIINSGGVKIMPEKIEKLVGSWLAQHNHPNRYFVSSLPHQQLGQQVILVLEGQLSHYGDLMKSLTEGLNKYEVPKQVYSAEKFKETNTGKIDRLNTMRIASPCPVS